MKYDDYMEYIKFKQGKYEKDRRSSMEYLKMEHEKLTRKLGNQATPNQPQPPTEQEPGSPERATISSEVRFLCNDSIDNANAYQISGPSTEQDNQQQQQFFFDSWNS